MDKVSGLSNSCWLNLQVSPSQLKQILKPDSLWTKTLFAKSSGKYFFGSQEKDLPSAKKELLKNKEMLKKKCSFHKKPPKHLSV